MTNQDRLAMEQEAPLLALLYQKHSDTSRDAAERIQPTAGTLRAKVLEYLRSQPDTDEAGQNALGMAQNTYRPRRVELVNLGLVRDSGRRGTTLSGRSAVIWEAVG